MSLLSRPEILAEMEKGNILIRPFNVDSLGPNSYDVTFGAHIWREAPPAFRADDVATNVKWCHGNLRGTLYNPYDDRHVNRVFTQDTAKPLRELFHEGQLKNIANINPEDLVVLISPGESILGHTVEFIGGCSNDISTTMFARSSIGRNFLEVCRCAGMGDIGYCTRWTMEITNNSQYYTIPLVVGRRIAQIEFSRTTPVKTKYTKLGKYQTEGDPAKLEATWAPEMMLPKLYLDREISVV